MFLKSFWLSVCLASMAVVVSGCSSSPAGVDAPPLCVYLGDRIERCALPGDGVVCFKYPGYGISCVRTAEAHATVTLSMPEDVSPYIDRMPEVQALP